MKALIFINIRTYKKIHQVLENFCERFNKKEAYYKFICISVHAVMILLILYIFV